MDSGKEGKANMLICFNAFVLANCKYTQSTNDSATKTNYEAELETEWWGFGGLRTTTHQTPPNEDKYSSLL